jgi:phosphatidylserine/phosphatidylglycerophosphate/cardiolipin synthase-like enzyme
MTADNSIALIFTFNPTRENLHYTRDFGVELHDSKVASEIDRLFFADWEDISFTPDPNSPLLISPFNSRQKMTSLLMAAEKSIHIADAKLEDPAIVKLLVEKARSGVEVQVLGDEKHRKKLPPAIASRATPRFKLHAKCTIIDGARAVIGSMNMRTQSFDRRREVSIVVDDADVIKRLNAVFTSDWENRTPTSARAATVISSIETLLSSPDVNAETGFVLLSRTDALVRHKLRQGKTSVGRSDDNDIIVPDPQVSRYHAQITLNEEDCTVTDLASGNGTFINGERLQGTAKLNQGDVVGFGGAEEFRLVSL